MYTALFVFIVIFSYVNIIFNAENNREEKVMKTIRQAKWCYIICSVLLAAVGVYMIVKPRASAVTLCCVVGMVAVIAGLAKIFGYLSHDLYNLAFQFDLSLGLFMVAFGVILLLKPGKVITLLPFIIGVLVLIDGVFKLQTAIDAKRFGLYNWWLILLGGILCIALSITVIADPFKGSDLIMIFTGIALTADGLQNLFNAFYTVKIMKGDKS